MSEGKGSSTDEGKAAGGDGGGEGKGGDSPRRRELARFTGRTDLRTEDFHDELGAGNFPEYASQFEFELSGSTYRVTKLYQSGAHGAVFLARKLDGDRALGEGFACKFFVARDDEELVNLTRMLEHDALEPHPNVITVVHHQTEALGGPGDPGRRGMVLMELGDLGEPFNFITTPFPESFCLRFFRDIIEGLEFMHGKGVVHRDLKPDNCASEHAKMRKCVRGRVCVRVCARIGQARSSPVTYIFSFGSAGTFVFPFRGAFCACFRLAFVLLSPCYCLTPALLCSVRQVCLDIWGRLKLCDFGGVKVVDDMSSRDKFTATVDVGSKNYMAPEVAAATARGVRTEGLKRKAEYNELCDIWSTGVLLLVLLTRRLVKPEFPAIGDTEWRRFLEGGGGTRVSADLQDLLGRIFTADPAERISIEQIKQHRWWSGPTPSDADFATELFCRNELKFADSIKIAPRARLADRGSVFYATAVGLLAQRRGLLVADIIDKLGLPATYKDSLCDKDQNGIARLADLRMMDMGMLRDDAGMSEEHIRYFLAAVVAASHPDPPEQWIIEAAATS